MRRFACQSFLRSSVPEPGGNRHHRHQRQDLGRALHRPSHRHGSRYGRGQRRRGEGLRRARYPRLRGARCSAAIPVDHARRNRGARAACGAARVGCAQGRHGSVFPRPRSRARRMRRFRRRRVHQPYPRSSGLPRRHAGLRRRQGQALRLRGTALRGHQRR